MPLTRAIKIDEEADILSRVYSDLDNYRRFYTMPEENDEETILIKFVAPKLFLFEDFRFTLLQESVTKDLEPKYYYRPDYLSYDEYDTINLWAMLLYINDIPTLEDFKVDTIKIPSKESILRLTRAASDRRPLEEVVQLFELPLKPTPPLFKSQIIVPPNRMSNATTTVSTPIDVYFLRDLFTLDIVDVRNRYVMLSEEPVSDSVNLNIVGSPNYLKGKHYDLIKGNKGFNKLTWDPRKLSSGVGLIDVMVEGIQFEVTYSKRVK